MVGTAEGAEVEQAAALAGRREAEHPAAQLGGHGLVHAVAHREDARVKVVQHCHQVVGCGGGGVRGL